MKKKILVIAGTFVLTVSGLFISKANKKFGAPTHLYIRGLNVTLLNTLLSGHLTTVKGVGAVTLYFATASGTLHTVFTSSTQNKNVYYK